MKKILAALFLLLQIAATTRTVYVNTDAGSNGDGSSGSPYSTLNNALSAETKDLVSNDRVLLIYVRGTAADTADISTNLNAFAGYTDATRYLRIVGDPSQSSGAHAGIWSTSKYRLTGTGDNIVSLSASSSRLDWRVENIQIANLGTGNFRRVLNIDRHPGEVYLLGNIIKATTAGSAYSYNPCINFDQSTAANKVTSLYLVNNVIYDCWSQCVYWVSTDTAGKSLIVYNNTMYNCGDAGETQNDIELSCSYEIGTVKLKNNILASPRNGSAYSRTGTCASLTTGNNISTDATSPDTAYRSKTMTFTDAANGDFHTSDTDSVDQGADLSGDATYAFSTDFERESRSGTWDIGADEYVSSGPSLIILKYAREN